MDGKGVAHGRAAGDLDAIFGQLVTPFLTQNIILGTIFPKNP